MCVATGDSSHMESVITMTWQSVRSLSRGRYWYGDLLGVAWHAAPLCRLQPAAEPSLIQQWSWLAVASLRSLQAAWLSLLASSDRTRALGTWTKQATRPGDRGPSNAVVGWTHTRISNLGPSESTDSLPSLGGLQHTTRAHSLPRQTDRPCLGVEWKA